MQHKKILQHTSPSVSNTFFATKPINVATVTNIPAPYRIPIYQILAQHWGHEYFKVFYCADKEGNRDWEKNNGFSHINDKDFNLLVDNVIKLKFNTPKNKLIKLYYRLYNAMKYVLTGRI